MERGATIGVVPGRGSGTERSDLFVLAEGTTPAGNEFAGHLVSQAERTWRTLDLSLTGALIHLFDEAQHALQNWNSRSISQHRVGLGLSCLALRGDRSVLATRGPASVIHISGATATHYEPDDEHAEAMSGDGPAPPQLTPLPLEPGDRVLLATTNVTEALDEELLGAILTLSLPEILPDLYRRITHLRDAAVLLMAVPDGDEIALAEPEPPPPAAGEPVIGEARSATAAAPPGEAGGVQSSLFVEDREASTSLELARQRLAALDARSRVSAAPPVRPLARPVEEAPLRRASGDGGALPHLPTPGRDAQAEAAPRGRTLLTTPGRSFSREIASTRQPKPPPVGSHHTNTTPVGELAAGRRLQIAAGDGAAAEGVLAESGRSTASAPRVRLRSAMGGGRRRGGSLAGAGTGGFSPPSWLIVLLGSLALAAVVAWAALPSLLESDSETRLAHLIDEAQREIATAGAVDDRGLSREALTRARGILLEAAAIEGGGDTSEPLLIQTERALAELDAIVAPAAIHTIADLRGFSETPIAARQLAISGAHAYLLDSAGAQVIAINLTTGEKTVTFAASERTPRAPIAIAWADASRAGGPALLVVDAGDALWAVSAAGTPMELAFARPDALTITDLHFTGGALYVLDAPQAAVFRFDAGPAGFGRAPATALQAPELAEARRVMVDGDIFTTGEDGVVRRFSGELTLVLAQSGIDTPLRAAETPHTNGPVDEIAILDASADRIVILGRNGAFLRQYRHEELRNLTAFATRDGFGYVLSGEQLRRITF